MNPARFISERLKFQGGIATVSVAISFLVIIIAVAVTAGFRTEMKKGITAISGDIQLTSPDMNYMSEDSPVLLSRTDFADSLPEVRDRIPAVYRAGIVKSGENIHGVLFKGTPDGPDSLGVRIPDRLAKMLGLKPGDRLLSYFIGEKVKVRNFTVREIYPTVIPGDNNLIVFAGLEDMQRLNGWSADEVSAVEVRLNSATIGNMELASLNISTRLLATVPEDEDVPLATTAARKFNTIFSWLDLLDLNAVLILVLMTIVAGFNMISGLLIMLFRNISTIGLLKALGMKDKKISEVFLRVASNVVLKGMLIGNLIGFGICAIQSTTHLLKLNPENYFLSYVPVQLNVPLILAADLLAYLLIMALLLIPALFVSRVDPAKTVRAQ
ncbi:lipoprotein-releasing system permease protein [Bacteroidales bacterium WCE2008]|nr:lipoprotein-releasing system permease protein [Bacteroidales bacterium WCE2008]